jgi:hypothetical protein
MKIDKLYYPQLPNSYTGMHGHSINNKHGYGTYIVRYVTSMSARCDSGISYCAYSFILVPVQYGNRWWFEYWALLWISITFCIGYRKKKVDKNLAQFFTEEIGGVGGSMYSTSTKNKTCNNRAFSKFGSFKIVNKYRYRLPLNHLLIWRDHLKPYRQISIADPGCLSRIMIFMHSGSTI